MSLSARKASLVMVAASIASVEALKDQGSARWIRLFNQHLQQIRVGSRATKMENAVRTYNRKEGTARRLEEKHRKVMQLGCWGPQPIRF